MGERDMASERQKESQAIAIGESAVTHNLQSTA